MPAHELWLPNPPKGTRVCAGFDGSENDDWTCIKMETLDGLIFTPRYGPDRRATIWNPKQWGGRIPRDELSWESEIEAWDRAYGPKKFLPWSMSGSSRIGAVYEALRRFEADLTTHRITQDGCPITRTHMMNARKVAKTLERYGLAKPQQNRKIDAAVTSVLAHEAACDARAAGWGARKHNYMLTGSSTRRRY